MPQKPRYDYPLTLCEPWCNVSADSFDAHPIEALCSQHTLARLSLILRKPRLSRLSTLPCYVSPMKLDSLSSLKSSSDLKELLETQDEQR